MKWLLTTNQRKSARHAIIFFSVLLVAGIVGIFLPGSDEPARLANLGSCRLLGRPCIVRARARRLAAPPREARRVGPLRVDCGKSR
jgi:hypothetical protein